MTTGTSALSYAELEALAAAAGAAMIHAQDVGCVDHLDCCDDGGEFWYSVLRRMRAANLIKEQR